MSAGIWERLNFDAFSHGQIKSKLWLCQMLELAPIASEPVNLEVYGSWYGSLVFSLLIRERLRIKSVNFYDLDSAALEISKKLHNYWLVENKLSFSFNVQNCQYLVPRLSGNSVIINSSCEHFADLTWWHNLPTGTFFALQGTDMPHVEHISPISSLDSWLKSLAPNKVFYSGVQRTEYPNFSFNRYMVLGYK